MANVMPTLATTWSNAVWYDADTNTALGRLPNSGDNVYLNNKVLTLNQVISIASITTYAYGSAVNGGRLDIITGGYSVTTSGNIDGGTSTSGLINISHYLGGNTDIICGGVIKGSSIASSSYGIYVGIGAGNTCNISFANIYNSPAGYNNIAIDVNCAGNVSLTKIGGAWKPTIPYANYAIRITALVGSSITINSSIDSNSLGTEKDIFASLASSGGNITLNGDYQGNNIVCGTTRMIDLANIAGTLIHNGNAKAGAAANVFSINAGNCKYKNIGGLLTGGATYSVIYNTQATSLLDLHSVLADGVAAVISSVSNEIIVRGNYATKNGIQAIYAPKFRLDPTTTATYTFQKGNNTDLILNNTNTDIGQPSENDVRKNVVFGSTNQFTGKAYIPNKAYVSAGVLVDVSDVGTFTGGSGATPKEIWDYILSVDPVVGGSAKERFLRQATTESVGQLLAND